MDDQLHSGVAGGNAAGEIRGNAHDAVHSMLQQQSLRGRHGSEHHRLEVGRELKPGRELDRIGSGVFDHDGDRNVLHVERQPVAEQQDENQRQHRADGDAGGVAHDLPGFLPYQRPDALKLSCFGS